MFIKSFFFNVFPMLYFDVLKTQAIIVILRSSLFYYFLLAFKPVNYNFTNDALLPVQLLCLKYDLFVLNLGKVNIEQPCYCFKYILRKKINHTWLTVPEYIFHYFIFMAICIISLSLLTDKTIGKEHLKRLIDSCKGLCA